MSARLQIADRVVTVAIAARRPDLQLEIDGRVVTVGDFRIEPDGAGVIEVGGRTVRFRRLVERDTVHLVIDGQSLSIGLLGSREDEAGAGACDGAVHAPMPGVVVEVFCAPGQSVAQGDLLMTIESMKLQSELKAPRDGVIAAVEFGVGGMFERDARLFAFEPLTEQ